VLTGGGAELKGIADYIQGVLGRAVRIGRPRGLLALPEAHGGPAFATLTGLALYAASNPIDLRGADPTRGETPRSNPQGFVHRLIAAFKSGY
jgi:cell division protein FtsA